MAAEGEPRAVGAHGRLGQGDINVGNSYSVEFKCNCLDNRQIYKYYSAVSLGCRILFQLMRLRESSFPNKILYRKVLEISYMGSNYDGTF
jgi:hypothetical protein